MTKEAGSSAGPLRHQVEQTPQEQSSPPRVLSIPREPLPTLWSVRGPLQIVVPSTLEVFQVARDLMALALPPTPVPQVGQEKRKAPVLKGKPLMGSPRWLHSSLEPRRASL